MPVNSTLFPFLTDLNLSSKSKLNDAYERSESDSGSGGKYSSSSESDFNFSHLDSAVKEKIFRLHSNKTEAEVVYHPQLPRFVQAGLTLIICTLLIAFTLIFIARTKKWCRDHSCRKCRPGSDTIELNSDRNADTPSTSTMDETSRNNFHPTSSRPKGKYGHRSPKEQFVRRASGPFGDEILAYADESYHFRTKPAPTDKIRYLTNFKSNG